MCEFRYSGRGAWGAVEDDNVIEIAGIVKEQRSRKADSAGLGLVVMESSIICFAYFAPPVVRMVLFLGILPAEGLKAYEFDSILASHEMTSNSHATNQKRRLTAHEWRMECTAQTIDWLACLLDDHQPWPKKQETMKQ